MNLPLWLQVVAMGLISGYAVWLGLRGSAPNPGDTGGAGADGVLTASGIATILVLMGGAAQGFRRGQAKWIRAGVEREQLERGLVRAEDYRGLFRHSSAPTLVVDPERAMIMDANDRACELFGVPHGTLHGLSSDDLGIVDAEFDTRMKQALQSKGNKELEIGVLRSDGARVDLLVTLTATEFQGRGAVLCVARDLTKHKALEDDLSHKAHHDPLTGLANRALFSERVETVIARAGESSTAAHVLYLDLDNFKAINDGLGHATGDQLLIEVAHRLRACTRITDTVARLGGDEFAILLENAAHEDAIMVASRVLVSLRITYEIEGAAVTVGSSIGIASSEHVDTAEELLDQADSAMYAAKRKGKGVYHVFGASASRDGRGAMTTELRHAVQREELELRFEPIVDLRSGQIAGFEALVHWQHPSKGLLAPESFVPCAEESGLIVPVGRWVLERACREAREWQRHYGPDDLAISINLSGRQLEEEDLAATVQTALERAGLAPECLTLEIAETVLVERGGRLVGQLQRIRDLGVHLAIAGFGVGRPSHDYVRRLPVDVLKLDRSFLSEPGGDPTLLRSILGLSHNLCLSTIAEGVETVEQLNRVRSLGCALAQGLYFSQPLTAARAGAFLYRNSLGLGIESLEDYDESLQPRATTSRLTEPGTSMESTTLVHGDGSCSDG